MREARLRGGAREEAEPEGSGDVDDGRAPRVRGAEAAADGAVEEQTEGGADAAGHADQREHEGAGHDAAPVARPAAVRRWIAAPAAIPATDAAAPTTSESPAYANATPSADPVSDAASVASEL